MINRCVQVLHPFGYERQLNQRFFLENSPLALPSLSDLPSRTFAMQYVPTSYAKPFICMEEELFGKTTKLFLMNHESFYFFLQSRLRCCFFFLVVHSSTLGPSPHLKQHFNLCTFNNLTRFFKKTTVTLYIVQAFEIAMNRKVPPKPNT